MSNPGRPGSRTRNRPPTSSAASVRRVRRRPRLRPAGSRPPAPACPPGRAVLPGPPPSPEGHHRQGLLDRLRPSEEEHSLITCASARDCSIGPTGGHGKPCPTIPPRQRPPPPESRRPPLRACPCPAPFAPARAPPHPCSLPRRVPLLYACPAVCRCAPVRHRRVLLRGSPRHHVHPQFCRPHQFDRRPRSGAPLVTHASQAPWPERRGAAACDMVVTTCTFFGARCHNHDVLAERLAGRAAPVP